MKRRLWACVGAMVSCLAGAANAAMILDTPYDLNAQPQAWTIGYTDPSGLYRNVQDAVEFTVNQQTVITSVAALIRSYAGPYSMTATLYSTTTNIYNEQLPDQALYSASFGIADSSAPLAMQGVTGLNWLLDAGNYWIGFSSPGYAGLGLASDGQGTRSYATRSVYGDMTWARSSSVDPAVQIQGDATGSASAVPEPETWVLMVGGFGLMGVAMRRRAKWQPSGLDMPAGR